MRAQVAAERAGDGGEDDVVDGPADRVLDPLDLARGRRARWRSAGRDRSSTLNGELGRRQPGAGEGPRRLGGVDGGRRRSVAGRGRRPGRRGRSRPGWSPARAAPRRAPGRRWARGGGSRARARAPTRGSGAVSKRTVVMSTPETPSTRQWWLLVDEREAAALDPVDQPHLPQRLRAVEALGEDPGRQGPQLLLVAGGRERGVADVVVEVELRVVDPLRPALAERDEAQLLAEAGDQVQARRRCARGARRRPASGPRTGSSRRRACAPGRARGGGTRRRGR